jgi:hypothetical protein
MSKWGDWMLIELSIFWTALIVLISSILSVIYARFFADDTSGTWFFTGFLGVMGIIVSLLVLTINYVSFV